MNAAGSALAWCAVQVAVVGLAAIAAYFLVSRLHHAAGGFTATTGLAVVFCLSAAAASPWPRWSFLDDRPIEEDDASGRGAGGLNPLRAALSKIFADPAATRAPPAGGGAAAMDGSAELRTPAVAVATGRQEEAPASVVQAALRDVPGTFWLNRPARPAPWRWTGSLAVMFAVGFLIGAVRLGLALEAVRATRRKSRPIEDGAMRQLFESLQRQLHSGRAIELLETDQLSAPATMGWRRPVILLPVAWRSWTVEERRAVLAHEIAHVERGDYLMWLAAQMALVLHFYHPAIHWLTARIRLEQECAADAAAAPAAGGTRAYVTALARLALRGEPPTKAAVGPSFLATRGVLLERIERLRRNDSDPGAATRWGSKVVAASILLTAAVAGSGFRGGSADEAIQERSPPAAAVAALGGGRSSQD